MKNPPPALVFAAALCMVSLTGCLHVPSPEEQLERLSLSTGLQAPADEPNNYTYLEKVHRGYPVLFRPQMGDVWGRFAARVVISETAPQLGRVGRFLSGRYEHVGTVVGSPLDRALSRLIGQPLSFFLVLKHGKRNVPRLDILSSFSTIQPDDPQPRRLEIGFRAGGIYSNDESLVRRISADQGLISRLSDLRSQYIRVDEQAVTFMFAGSETEWSATLREHGGYPQLLNQVMDMLADIADKL